MEYFYYLRFACSLNYPQWILSVMLDPLNLLVLLLTLALLNCLCYHSLVEEIVQYYSQYEVDSKLAIHQAMVILHLTQWIHQ